MSGYLSPEIIKNNKFLLKQTQNLTPTTPRLRQHNSEDYRRPGSINFLRSFWHSSRFRNSQSIRQDFDDVGQRGMAMVSQMGQTFSKKQAEKGVASAESKKMELCK
jgi:hypothetical protein